MSNSHYPTMSQRSRQLVDIARGTVKEPARGDQRSRFGLRAYPGRAVLRPAGPAPRRGADPEAGPAPRPEAGSRIGPSSPCEALETAQDTDHASDVSLSESNSGFLARNGYPWDRSLPGPSTSKTKCTKWVQSSNDSHDPYAFEDDMETEEIHQNTRPSPKRTNRTLTFEEGQRSKKSRRDDHPAIKEKTSVAKRASGNEDDGDSSSGTDEEYASDSSYHPPNCADDASNDGSSDLLSMPRTPDREVHETPFDSEEEGVDDPAIPETDKGTENAENALGAAPNTPQEEETATPSQSQSSQSGRRRSTPRDNVRKRAVSQDKWLRNIAKAQLNAGEYHVTPKGVVHQAREIKPACRINCKKCKRPLTQEERENTFTTFWALANINRKRDFISRHVKTAAPKTCSTLPEMAKNSIRTYFFLFDGVEVRVCKKMFLSTLGIADCWVETALKKCVNGSSSPDKRGKHKNRPNRTVPATHESVKRHINSFPRIQSHYTRARTRREYLETGLSVEQMHRMYCDWMLENDVSGTKPASLPTYRNIFNREFNLGFFLPRKDQCELCNKWKNAKDNAERRVIVQQYKTHLENKKAVNSLKNKDKETASSTKCVAAFDLQKVLSCPRSETSLFFYKNKLSIFNFTVFDLRLKEGHCFLWNETEAKKGANEIATNLYNFIALKVGSGCNNFLLYSDSPSGQNRNRMVFSMYSIASAKFKIRITHRFLESGHSYSEVDSMHARIENEVKRKDIYNQEEWCSSILRAKHAGEVYRLHMLRNEDVLNFHALVDRQDWDKNTDGEKVKWSKVREVSCSYDSPNVMKYRNNFTDELKTVNLSMKNNEMSVSLEDYQPPRAFEKQLALRKNKQEDIRWLMDQQAIPTKYHDEYNRLLSID